MEAAVELADATDTELHVVSTVPELPNPCAVTKVRRKAIF
jgi:hypothetical protein